MAPIKFNISDIETALDVKTSFADNGAEEKFSSVSTDSRTIDKADLFVALKGERFDGHAFIPDLVKKGVKGFVVETAFSSAMPSETAEILKNANARLFKVENTVTALGDLARYQRMRSRAKVVAITGSNGKTTTREMTAGIFSRTFNTLSTMGNLNNEIGLPLTLLQLSDDHEWAVVEMGMNHFGEIEKLSRIAVPDIGVITNTSDAHLQGLKDVNGVARAKSEIFLHANKNAAAVLPAADPRIDILTNRAKENPDIQKIIYFGENSGPAGISAQTARIENGNLRFKIRVPEDKAFDVGLNCPAQFMVSNSLAACAASRIAGIDTKTIKDGLEAFTPVKGRMNVIRMGQNITLIDDTYNANPESMKAAIDTLKTIAGGGFTIAALGDMLEMGDNAAYFHQEIGKSAAEAGISKLYCHGDLAGHIIKGALDSGYSSKNTYQGPKKDIAEAVLHEAEKGPVCILVKGSRSMKMEEVIEAIKNLLQKQGTGN